MAYLTQQWRFGWLFILSCTFYFHQALPSEVRAAHKVAATRDESNAGSIETTTEGLQRMCLIRLKQAVKDVCSGSGSIPIYYNPTGLFLMNQTEIHGLSSGVANRRHVRNYDPTMTERNRKILRRRSRRNIVRECCMKPCRLSSLRKYCASNRDETQVKPMPAPAPASVSSLNLNNGKMSTNPSFNVNTLVDGGRNCLHQPYCTMEIAQDSTPEASSQCNSVKDLQNFYFKLFRTQYKKDDEKISAMGFNNDNKPDTHPSIMPTQLNEQSAHAYSIATNRMFRNKFATKENLLQHASTDRQPSQSAPETNGGDENKEDNEIGVSTESYQGRRSSQIRTAKPIPFMFNLPKGTNDYLY